MIGGLFLLLFGGPPVPTLLVGTNALVPITADAMVIFNTPPAIFQAAGGLVPITADAGAIETVAHTPIFVPASRVITADTTFTDPIGSDTVIAEPGVLTLPGVTISISG